VVVVLCLSHRWKHTGSYKHLIVVCHYCRLFEYSWRAQESSWALNWCAVYSVLNARIFLVENYRIFRLKRLTKVCSCVDVKFITVRLWGGRDLGMPIMNCRAVCQRWKWLKTSLFLTVRQSTENNLQRKLPRCNVWPPLIILYWHIKCPKLW